ncbi:carbon-nitrogen hydrolase family protein [Thalassospira alkalitolerans]|uniref:Nitrilase n=1 Tax=Thalassospira alkalitolerans TaxID=1293890 RepID=A0A1Y2L7G3_9PROT|nr:carbon-nitrogen hydrolase family protein [Thalassospira alkalitolerans]OSQ44605.1 nitrilase [Thalassospira alkalitolerans]
MKIALYQGPPTDGDIERTLSRINSQLQAAATAGATMVVFPELFLPGYNRPDLHPRLAQTQGGAWIEHLSSMAINAKCGLTIGWAERDGDGQNEDGNANSDDHHGNTIYNAATCIDANGKMIGHYRKIQLFGPMENQSFCPGTDYCVFNLDGIPAALLICYDVEFAPHVRALADRGVKLILVPTANPKGFEHVSRVMVPARATEMSITIVYANYCGTEQGLEFAGRSLIVGPDANIIASAGTSETLLVAAITNPINSALLSTQLSDFTKGF